MCRSLSSLGLCLVLVSFSAAQRPPPPPVAGVPTKPPAWVAPTSNASSAGGRRGARRAQEVKEVYPYQIARIPPPPAKFVPGSGSVIAYVYTMFEVDTQDWVDMKKRLTKRVAQYLFNVDSTYLDMYQITPLKTGSRCSAESLVCHDKKRDSYLYGPGAGGASVDGDLSDVDPRDCGGVAGSSTDMAKKQIGPTINEFKPEWDTVQELEDLVWEINFCISQHNTSVMLFPLPLNNTYITGYRWENERIRAGNMQLSHNQELGIGLELHIVGVIPISWARFFNQKFILNGSIPLPLFQPEVLDVFATNTDFLNISLYIYGVRQSVGGIRGSLLDYMPVCVDPPVEAKGCFRIDHLVYEHPAFNEYGMKSVIYWQRYTIAEELSDFNYPFGEWNASAGPWPSMLWRGPRMTPEANPMVYNGPWSQFRFPQKGYSLEALSFCKTGSNCTDIPVAPTPRYLHTAVLYYTWDFKQHAFKYLCDEKPECGDDCLHNMTCLGGNDYYSTNFYFRSPQFANDDGGTVSPRSLSDVDCPRDCCRDRRKCMRLTDVLGYKVPFNSPMILVWGGKTYTHVKDPETGRLVYHSCERIAQKTELREEWRSCSEVTSNELWRYDINQNKWEFLKTDSATSPTTGQPVGWPNARFAHGAAIIERADGQDEGQKRIYMYIFGGMGSQCTSGVCNDVWRYEVPWAAQAFYPKFPEGEWVRGNLWDRLKDCPYGGRYRMAMVSTKSQEYIYVYGGQTLGGFSNTLLRYRISTDLWEDMRPYGRVSLVRLMYNYQGVPLPTLAPVELYDEESDVDCSVAWRFDGKYSHCKVCPTCRLVIGRREDGAIMPPERGDSGLANFYDATPGSVDDAMVVFGGFRTTWGALSLGDPSCQANAQTTTSTTMTVQEMKMDANGAISLTDAPVITSLPPIGPETTTTLQGGIQVIGSFDTLGGDQNSETTAEPYSTMPPTTTLDAEALAAPPGGPSSTSTTATLTATNPDTSTTSTFTTVTLTTTFDFDLPFTPPPTTTLGYTTAPPVVNGAPPKFGNASFQPQNQATATGAARQGPAAGCVSKYYFNDLWYYDSTMNRWSEVSSEGDEPTRRKGHALMARNSRSNDTQLVVFGGHMQDESMNDLWVIYVKRPGNERKWTKVDKFFPGERPPSMSHHTMTYVPELDTAFVFGGLHWSRTDLAETDRQRNIDRRCFKEAQGLPMTENGQSEAAFLVKMVERCISTLFCCAFTEALRNTGESLGVFFGNTRIRTSTGALNLTAVSDVCRTDCSEKAFYPEFYPIMSEGVWSLNMSSCPGNCNGHGMCDFSQCVCEPGFYGADCSQKKCEGMICYADAMTKEQFCSECSGHGKCIRGNCVCDAGWGYADCSAPLCESNCSSTPDDVRGVCIYDFPVHQCHCFEQWSGHNCSQLLCLNGCSDRGTCTNGACACHKGFHGMDCSIFLISLENEAGT